VVYSIMSQDRIRYLLGGREAADRENLRELLERISVRQTNGEAKLSWTNFRVSSAQFAKGEGSRVLKQFTAEWTPLGAPRDMAMHSLQQPGDDFATFYLSPGTQRHAPDLVRSLGAQPGERPPG
jgi:hypothetical protein